MSTGFGQPVELTIVPTHIPVDAMREADLHLWRFKRPGLKAGAYGRRRR